MAFEARNAMIAWIGSSGEAGSSRFFAESSGIVTRRTRIMIYKTFLKCPYLWEYGARECFGEALSCCIYEENLPEASYGAIYLIQLARTNENGFVTDDFATQRRFAT